MKKSLIILLLLISFVCQAQVKVSSLPEATSINNTDLYLLTQGGVSKKLQHTNLKLNLKAYILGDTTTKVASRYWVNLLIGSYIPYSDTLTKIATWKYVADHSGGSFPYTKTLDSSLNWVVPSGKSIQIAEPDILYGFQLYKPNSNSWSSYLSGGNLNNNYSSSLSSDSNIYINIFAKNPAHNLNIKIDTLGIDQTNVDTSKIRGTYTPTWAQMKREIAANSGGNDSTLQYNTTKKTWVPYANYTAVNSLNKSGSIYNFDINSQSTYPVQMPNEKYYAFQGAFLGASTFFACDQDFPYYSQLQYGGLFIQESSTNNIYKSLTSNATFLSTASALADSTTMVVIANNGATKVKIKGNGIIVINNDTVPVRKKMAADTTGLTGHIGDSFIDTGFHYWLNKKNGRGGWVKVYDLWFIPFVYIRRKYLKYKIS